MDRLISKEQIEMMETNLKAFRTLFRWTAEEVATQLGITRQTVINHERGVNQITIPHYLKLRVIYHRGSSRRPKKPGLLIFSQEKHLL